MTRLNVRFAGLGAIDLGSDPPEVIFPLRMKPEKDSLCGVIPAHFVEVFLNDKSQGRIVKPGKLDFSGNWLEAMGRPTLAFRNLVVELDKLCNWDEAPGRGGPHIHIPIPGGDLDVANDDSRCDAKFIDAPSEFPANGTRAFACQVTLTFEGVPEITVRGGGYNNTFGIADGDVLLIANYPPGGPKPEPGQPTRDFELFYRMLTQIPNPPPVPIVAVGAHFLNPGIRCVPMLRL